MPITFSCKCGKSFKVKDEFAGKRSKCTGCATPLVVPKAEPEFEVIEDDPGFEVVDDEPVATRGPAPRANRSQEVKSFLPPSFKPAPASTEEPPTLAPLPVESPPPSRPKRRKRKPRREEASSFNAAVGTGLLMMIGAVVWFIVGLQAGYIFFYPPVLFVLGMISVGKGLTGNDA